MAQALIIYNCSRADSSWDKPSAPIKVDPLKGKPPETSVELPASLWIVVTWVGDCSELFSKIKTYFKKRRRKIKQREAQILGKSMTSV